MDSDTRAKKVERLMLLTWSSLVSHLPYTYKKSADGRRFEKQCVKDYAEMIKLLSELL